MGTSGPKRPSASTSRGPLGQSVATTGVPSAMASVRTFGEPSQRDESANTLALARNG
jgi:hypothetical protein